MVSICERYFNYIKKHPVASSVKVGIVTGIGVAILLGSIFAALLITYHYSKSGVIFDTFSKMSNKYIAIRTTTSIAIASLLFGTAAGSLQAYLLYKVGYIKKENIGFEYSC